MQRNERTFAESGERSAASWGGFLGRETRREEYSGEEACLLRIKRGENHSYPFVQAMAIKHVRRFVLDRSGLTVQSRTGLYGRAIERWTRFAPATHLGCVMLTYNADIQCCRVLRRPSDFCAFL